MAANKGMEMKQSPIVSKGDVPHLQWVVEASDRLGVASVHQVSALDAAAVITVFENAHPGLTVRGLAMPDSRLCGASFASLSGETAMGGATVVVDDMTVAPGHIELLVGWPNQEISSTVQLNIAVSQPFDNESPRLRLDQAASRVNLVRDGDTVRLSSNWVFCLGQ